MKGEECVSIVQICLRPRFQDQAHLAERASQPRSRSNAIDRFIHFEPETGSDPAAYRPGRITL